MVSQAVQLFCWGGNDEGQLGNGGGDDVDTPPSTPVALPPTIQVSYGYRHTCTVTLTGSLYFGFNSYGQLSTGDQISTAAPNPAQPVIASGVASVSAGHYHTCALMLSGGVRCFGDDFSGELDGMSGSPVVSAPGVDMALQEVV